MNHKSAAVDVAGGDAADVAVEETRLARGSASRLIKDEFILALAATCSIFARQAVRHTFEALAPV